MLENREVDELGRALQRLEGLGSQLEALLIPSPPASGTNAGRPANRPGSRPPVSLRLLDVQVTAQRCLRRWCVLLASVSGKKLPSGGVAGAAAWLHAVVWDVAAQPWARACLDETLAVARWVGDVVDPQPPAEVPRGALGGSRCSSGAQSCSQGDGVPVAGSGGAEGAYSLAASSGVVGGRQSGDEAGDGVKTAGMSDNAAHGGLLSAAGRFSLQHGTARQVSQALAILGVQVSHTTIRRWAKAGLITGQVQADGSQRYKLAEVWSQANAMGSSQAVGRKAAP